MSESEPVWSPGAYTKVDVDAPLTPHDKIFGGRCLKMFRLLLSLGVLAVASVLFVSPPNTANAQQGGQCPASLTVALSIPPEGAANVTATVLPEVALATPGQGAAGTYFFAWLADLDPVTALSAGQPVPVDNPRIIRGASRTQNFDHLGAGDHRVTAVLVGSDGVPCGPFVSAAITFRLQAPNPPATGSGERVPSATESILVALGLILVGSSTVALAFSRRLH